MDSVCSSLPHTCYPLSGLHGSMGLTLSHAALGSSMATSAQLVKPLSCPFAYQSVLSIVVVSIALPDTEQVLGKQQIEDRLDG